MRQLHGYILGSEATESDCLLRADEKHDQRCKSYALLSTFSGPGAVLGHWKHWETGIMTPSLLTRKARLRKGRWEELGRQDLGFEPRFSELPASTQGSTGTRLQLDAKGSWTQSSRVSWEL